MAARLAVMISGICFSRISSSCFRELQIVSSMHSCRFRCLYALWLHKWLQYCVLTVCAMNSLPHHTHTLVIFIHFAKFLP